MYDRNRDKNKPKETNNQYHWPSGTCASVCDFMVNGISKKMYLGSMAALKVFTFRDQELKISITT